MSGYEGASLCLCDADKILIIQRAYPPFQRQWAFVGGKVEAGETAAEAALREMREEMGLEAENLILVKTIIVPHDGKELALSCFKAPYSGGTPTPNHEIRCFRWVTIEEAHQLPLAQGMTQMLDALKA